MSDVARPKENSVAARTIRTLKSQLVKCNDKWPQRVTSLAQVILVFEKRVSGYAWFLNHQSDQTFVLRERAAPLLRYLGPP